jgi:hypothetical protein
MRRPVVAFLVSTSLFLILGFSRQPTPGLAEKTLVLRVREANPITDPTKMVKFSGVYKTDTGEEIQISDRVSFGVIVKSSSLNGQVQKESGDNTLLVELIEFINDKEVGYESSKGNSIAFEASPNGDRYKLRLSKGLPK